MNDTYNLSLSVSEACQVDVAVSTSSRHADLSSARRLAVARPKLRGVNCPSLSSAKIVSVYQVCDASLWKDPECTTEELGNGLDWDRHD